MWISQNFCRESVTARVARIRSGVEFSFNTRDAFRSTLTAELCTIIGRCYVTRSYLVISNRYYDSIKSPLPRWRRPKSLFAPENVSLERAPHNFPPFLLQFYWITPIVRYCRLLHNALQFCGIEYREPATAILFGRRRIRYCISSVAIKVPSETSLRRFC